MTELSCVLATGINASIEEELAPYATGGGSAAAGTLPACDMGFSGEVGAAEGERGGSGREPDPDTGFGEPVSLLTGPLGLHGWGALETVLLAAVASGTPLLLVGPHGCAKSYFLEKLAQALALEYRFYNASLINYDDLVGIPVPAKDGKHLEYITTPTAIWDAEAVFMDEINRTKPEMQNKLFPIIHERRVQGVRLEKLRYRWAAMNPPMPEDDYDEAAYLGTEPLDTALADRFGFIIEVPSWSALSHEDKISLLRNHRQPPSLPEISPDRLIQDCGKHLDRLREAPPADLHGYLVLLWNELQKAGASLSTRRMTMLLDNILATHAASRTLFPDAEADWSVSAWQALQHSLPQRAQGNAPESLKLNAAHLQAWALMTRRRGSDDFSLLTISDSLERACEALRCRDRLAQETVAAALVHFLSDDRPPAETCARVLALYAVLQNCYVPASPVLDAMAGGLSGIFRTLAPPLQVPRSDTAYVKTLVEPVPDDISAKESLLRHYDKNLAMHIYETTRDRKQCSKAIGIFRTLYKTLGKAMAATSQETANE